MANRSLTPTAYLERVVGHPIGLHHALFDSAVTVGRSNQCQICIHDPNVSRNHFSLNYASAGWSIKDLGGVNGTFLDGHRLVPNQPYLLREGTTISLGPPQDAPYAYVFIIEDVTECPIAPCPVDSTGGANDIVVNDTAEQIQPVPEQRQPEPSINGHDIVVEQSQPGSTLNSHDIAAEQSRPGPSQPGPSLNLLSQPGTSFQTLKRKSEEDSMTGSETQMKRPTPDPLDLETSIESIEEHDELNFSSCSISSMDSLNTRIRKQSAKRDASFHKKRVVRHKWKLPCPALGERPKLSFMPANELINIQNQGSGEVNSESLLNHSSSIASPSLPVNMSPDVLIRNLQYRVASLQKKLCKNDKALKKATSQNINLSAKLKDLTTRGSSVAITKEELNHMLEEELKCTICFNILIKATVLDCSHTFCNHCILEWKSKKRECPNCRESITSYCRVRTMDNLIDSMIKKMDTEYQESRMETLKEVEVFLTERENKIKRKKRGRRRSFMAIRRPARPNPFGVPVDLLTYDDHMETYPTIQAVFSAEMNMNEYQCYHCGERGHYASACPNR